jgi:SAM-dependent methyltransferase
MIEVAACVICQGRIRRLKRALVAPFLATRIWRRAPFCVDLVECQACGFMFYNPRLDGAEEARLYAGYRSAEYRQMRQASEPWYSAQFNADLASPGSYEIRRGEVGAILRRHLAQREIKRILDYGGDHGDLVRGLIEGATAFVYDISGMPAADGVTATSDPAECQADLIINSNVLEHVGFPRRLVGEILQSAPHGGLIFLEVPCEAPFSLTRIARRVAQVAVMSLTQPALARALVRPAGLYMMHEHINYFTERSLTTLLWVCGCEVIAAGSYVFAGRAGKGDLAWCLGIAP